MLAEAFQTTLEDAVPLSEVEFVIVDLETTGGSPADCRITEIGAVKLRGGERTGVFETLVNPGVPIPRQIMAHWDRRPRRGRRAADRVVLPSFAEFARGCVFVAHNARFDFTFLNVALERLDYDALPPPPVCTARLARVVWPDVPNVRLHTLAQYFRTAVRPSHRAPDAEACSEVLHGLLELGGRLGIATLGDLHGAVRARGVELRQDPPCRPPARTHRVSTCSEGATAACSTGKSMNLRSRVKSYFYGDERKKVEDLLAETVSVDGVACGPELESLVLEARLIREHEPKYNRRGKTWRKYAYLRVDDAEAYPGSRSSARPRAAARSSVRSHRPTWRVWRRRPSKTSSRSAVAPRMRASTRFAPCALAEMHRCLAPCDGRVGPERYEQLVPLPDLLPLHTGRAPRNARGADARPRGTGTVRGGCKARSSPSARRGAGSRPGSTAGARDR